MILNEEEKEYKLTQEVKQNYEQYFNNNGSDSIINKKSELINSNDNENEIKGNNIRLEKNNINDAKEEINSNNENNNKLETGIIENGLSNSGTKNFILVKSNNIKKKIFVVQNCDGNKKRGRAERLEDQRNHIKYDKDNLELKIKGIVIDIFY